MKTPFLPVLLLFAAGLARGTAETNCVVPGDNLVVEGIPAIPSSLADEIGRYTEMRSATFTSWHPNKREMLVITRFANAPQVHRVETPMGARQQLTFFSDTVSGASYQPTRGEYFIFNKDIGGNENFQKYRYDLASGTITLLSDGNSRNTGGIWSNDGRKYVYGSTRRNGQDVDLWMVDPLNPSSTKMIAQLQGGGWTALDFSPDDRKLLVSEEISINESYLWLIDMATGERKPLTPRNETQKAAYNHGQFDKNGHGVFVTTDRGSEFQQLAHIDIATQHHTYLTTQYKWDVDEFQCSWDGKIIAFVVNEEGLSSLHVLDVSSGKERSLPQLPRGQITALEWHRNNRDLGFVAQTAHHPPDAFSIDIKSGKVERWTRSETGGLDPGGFSEPELVRWKSFDGRMISGWLYRPAAKFQGKRPVIVNIHGGPESQFRPGFQRANNYYLNELGVAVLHPNVRGSAGFGKTFLKLDNGFLREDSYKDIAALLDWIGTAPGLDGSRVMVTGGSYGGHMTLAVATYYPDRIRCALDVVGISNLATFLEHTSAYRRDLRRIEYGDERDPKMREFLNRTAPLNNAAKISKPLFIVQGGNDPRVPLSEAEQMAQTARKNGTTVWYLMAKDEGHGFSKKRNSDFQLYATVSFIRQFLLN